MKTLSRLVGTLMAVTTALTLLASCGGAASESSAPMPMTQEQSAPASAGDVAVAPAAPAAPAAGGSAAPGTTGSSAAKPGAAAQNQQAAPFQRLVIKNAELSLQVENVEKAEAALRARIDELGGYVVNAESSGSDESASLRISFRVPAAQFDAALSGAEGLAKKLVSRSIKGEDVTEEYVDLESQLRNLEATRDRLLTFLDKATRVDDALQVNQAISEVQGQIEQIQGRMKYLKQSAALSTVDVSLMPVPTTPIVDEDSWQPVQIARSALRDLLSFGQGLVNIAIVLGIWLPVWLPLLLLGRWGWLRLRALFRRKPPVAPAPAEPVA